MARILLVDDEPDIRVLTRMILEKAGYEVIEAKDGEECLQKLQVETPDLILMDIRMPKMSGGDACRRIREKKEFTNMPVAIFSVLPPKEIEEDVRSCFTTHITKPYDSPNLLKTIRNLVGAS